MLFTEDISISLIIGLYPKSPNFVLTLFLIKFVKSYLEQPSKSPNSYTLSIKSSSSLSESKAASFIAVYNSGVFKLGFSSSKVLNNQHPASECIDSSLIDHSTI